MTFDPATMANTVADLPPAKAPKNQRRGQSKPDANEQQPAADEAAADAEAPASTDPPAETTNEATAPPAEPSADDAAAVDAGPVATAIIELPIHVHSPGYATPRCDASGLSQRQAAALNFLWSSMSDLGERCQTRRSSHPQGAVVEKGPDALRRILDQVADQIEAQTKMNLVTDFGFTFR
jgi:hypothetical protein